MSDNATRLQVYQLVKVQLRTQSARWCNKFQVLYVHVRVQFSVQCPENATDVKYVCTGTIQNTVSEKPRAPACADTIQNAVSDNATDLKHVPVQVQFRTQCLIVRQISNTCAGAIQNA